VLKSAVRSLALSLDGSTPLEGVQIQDEELIEPILAIASAENEHLVVDDTSRVELPHGCFASDDAGDVEAEFVDAFFEVDKNDVR